MNKIIIIFFVCIVENQIVLSEGSATGLPDGLHTFKAKFPIWVNLRGPWD
jgi:hypothetical protein